MRRLPSLALPLALLLALAPVAADAAAESDTARAGRLLESLRDQPARLRVFLRAMPKGGDLHNHLWGAVYAETMVAEAGATGLCVTMAGDAIVPPPCGAGKAVPAAGLATRNPALYSNLIDSLSMRGYVAGPTANPVAGHDRFFATFDRFAPIAAGAPGMMLAAARELAANDHVSYLETQSIPPAVGEAAALAVARKVPADDPAAAFTALAPDLPRLVAAARGQTDDMERDAAARLGCATTAVTAAPPPACAVTVRYQGYALRALPPQVVFGQLLMAFALADADPRYVGVNIVQPEDAPVALADYDRHMAMLRWLSARYPRVPMSLHAGELSLGLVPPGQLRDHIAKAVAVGARRIGHGVDISYEADAPALLARMARDRIAVEINLTSNDTILGVRGRDHPLAMYRAAGVPIVISTDDEGVSRSDMTNEYLRAVTEQGLGYADLKAAARASITYGFLAGDSLWRPGAIGSAVAACAAGLNTTSCRALIGQSDKAAAETALETALATFEMDVARQPF